MLLAFGAASAALNAINSLTSSKPSASQPIGSVAAGSPFEISASSSADNPTGAGFGAAAQISPDTFSALFAAQSQASTGLQLGTSGLSSDPLLPAPTTSYSAASSSYSATEQLIQGQANAMATTNMPLSINV